MTTIREEDFIQSVADAFQFISYYHPVDYIRPLHEAYEREESPAAKDAMAQILINSRMAAEGHRPICQDTGIAIAFIKRRHGRALGHEDVARGTGERRRAPRLHRQGQSAARLDARRPGRQAEEHRRQHARGHARRARARRQGRGDRRGEGRRLARTSRKFAMLLPSRLHRRLGAVDRADHGRRLVPARHALARHRRLAREGDADGQVGNDGAASTSTS